jgi:hypothetical protein
MFSTSPRLCSLLIMSPTCSRIAARKIASPASNPLATITRPAMSSLLSSSPRRGSEHARGRAASTRSERSSGCGSRFASLGRYRGPEPHPGHPEPGGERVRDWSIGARLLQCWVHRGAGSDDASPNTARGSALSRRAIKCSRRAAPHEHSRAATRVRATSWRDSYQLLAKPAWMPLGPLYLSSHTSSKRQLLKTLLTTRLRPLTRGRQQVAARV